MSWVGLSSVYEAKGSNRIFVCVIWRRLKIYKPVIIAYQKCVELSACLSEGSVQIQTEISVKVTTQDISSTHYHAWWFCTRKSVIRPGSASQKNYGAPFSRSIYRLPPLDMKTKFTQPLKHVFGSVILLNTSFPTQPRNMEFIDSKQTGNIITGSLERVYLQQRVACASRLRSCGIVI